MEYPSQSAPGSISDSAVGDSTTHDRSGWDTGAHRVEVDLTATDSPMY